MFKRSRTQKPQGGDPKREEKGQSLVVILMLGALLAFFGTVLTKMLVREAANIVNTKKRDKLFSAGDAALQRSSSVMLADDTVWADPTKATGYISISGSAAVGFSEVPGVTYYIRITPGAMVDVSGTGAATDADINKWVNKGSLLNDRTIFVRTVDVNGKEDRFFTTVHRTDAPPFTWGGNAISAAGSITLGNNWEGHVYNSCYGPYNGSGALPNSEGSITVGGNVEEGVSKFNNGGEWSGYNYNPGTNQGAPALVVPTGTVALPGYATSSDVSGSNVTITLTNAVDGTLVNYECRSLDIKTLTVNGPGKIALWITGPTGGTRFGMGGNADVIVNKNGSSECCVAKLFTVYVTANDPTTNDVSIAWHGCPTGNFMVVGPLANMDFRGGGSNVFFGALNVRNLVVAPNSTAKFYYDACLKTKPPVDNYSAPPLLTTTWQQIGLKTQAVP